MLRNISSVTALAAVALAAFGCTDKPHAKAAPHAANAPAYYTALPRNEFMLHVMQYAGDGIWRWQGTIYDRTGEHSLLPKNDKDWEDAESGARTLAEVTNVLLIPGRRVDEPEWDAAVARVRQVALQAAEAAEKHDVTAWEDAGGVLDGACDECHVRYDPSFKNQPKTAGGT